MDYSQSYPLSPCKGCTYRALGCHSNCSAYLKYRTALDSYNEFIRSAKKANRLITSYQINKSNSSRR